MTGAATSISVSNIPVGFKYLMIFCSLKKAASDEMVSMILNDDVGAHYYDEETVADNAAISCSFRNAEASYRLGYCSTANWTLYNAQISMYPDSEERGIITQGGSVDVGAPQSYFTAGRWSGTAYITKITISAAHNFAIGSRLCVYGVQ